MTRLFTLVAGLPSVRCMPIFGCKLLILNRMTCLVPILQNHFKTFQIISKSKSKSRPSLECHEVSIPAGRTADRGQERIAVAFHVGVFHAIEREVVEHGPLAGDGDARQRAAVSRRSDV